MSNSHFEQTLSEIQKNKYTSKEIKETGLNNSDTKKLMQAIAKNLKLASSIEKIEINQSKALSEIEIKDLPNLTQLKLDDNNLEKIKCKNLENLRVLILAKNSFRDFDINDIDIADFQEIKRFDISGNLLHSFKLSKPLDIEILDISKNPITCLFFSGEENIGKVKFCNEMLQTELGVALSKSIIQNKLNGMFIDDVYEILDEDKKAARAWLKGLSAKEFKKDLPKLIEHILNVEGEYSFKDMLKIIEDLFIMEKLKSNMVSKKLKALINLDLKKLSDDVLLQIFKKAFKKDLENRLNLEEKNLNELLPDLDKTVDSEIRNTNLLCKQNTKAKKIRNKDGWPMFRVLFKNVLDEKVKELAQKLKEPLKNRDKFIAKKLQNDVEQMTNESNLGREFVNITSQSKSKLALKLKSMPK